MILDKGLLLGPPGIYITHDNIPSDILYRVDPKSQSLQNPQ